MGGHSYFSICIGFCCIHDGIDVVELLLVILGNGSACDRIGNNAVLLIGCSTIGTVEGDASNTELPVEINSSIFRSLCSSKSICPCRGPRFFTTSVYVHS